MTPMLWPCYGWWDWLHHGGLQHRCEFLPKFNLPQRALQAARFATPLRVGTRERPMQRTMPFQRPHPPPASVLQILTVRSPTPRAER